MSIENSVAAARRSPQDIWSDDLFERLGEAEQLLAYIDSVAGRPLIREDKKAYTIAVDAGYGVGKTFFLKRFAEHASLTHPVAFVDAWSDDLADEPLTALVATLQKALEPLSTPATRDRMSDFMRKTGRVAGIVATGLLKRGLSLAITASAVDAAEGVLSGVNDAVKDAVDDGIKAIGDGAIEDAASHLSSANLMSKRVARFEDGRRAIREMKDSLEAIVQSIRGEDIGPPIIIVIDELDRCRPTYAIKLLEEIKHLFDVPGLVFVLGMHAVQLSHSVAGAYGATFDGSSYLRRFIDRRYELTKPSMISLIRHLTKQFGIPTDRFVVPRLEFGDNVSTNTFSDTVDAYARAYELSIRDLYSLMDMLQTSAALCGEMKIYLVYILPLAIARIKQITEILPPSPEGPSFTISTGGRFGENVVSPEAMAIDFLSAAQMNYETLMKAINSENTSRGVQAVKATYDWNGDGDQPIWNPVSYPRLLATVARFKNPEITAA